MPRRRPVATRPDLGYPLDRNQQSRLAELRDPSRNDAVAAWPRAFGAPAHHGKRDRGSGGCGTVEASRSERILSRWRLHGGPGPGLRARKAFFRAELGLL